MERFKGTLFGLKRVGKYLTDGELRKAYSEYKESEEMALRLIVNTILSEGWMITLSQPKTKEDLSKEFGYTNDRLLSSILKLLTENNVINDDNGVYSIRELKATPIRPEDVGTVLTNFYYDSAQFLPDALRGHAVPLDQVPRIVLEAVFSSMLTEKGRAVLLRSFSPKKSSEIGVAAFADVGLPYALRQINEIFEPKRIHLFMQNYRWLTPITSSLQLLSEENILGKLTTDLLGRKIESQLDVFYGEEIFAYSVDSFDERVGTIASYLKVGGKLITNDPTYHEGESTTSPAYSLMQTIEGYPQPLERELIQKVFEKHLLSLETLGDNWIIAEKVGEA
ncbi:MAG: hypothetical protein ACW98Y_08030 [Candidatus Thorarchaeota archaeon]|jgi:hypothetical protein